MFSTGGCGTFGGPISVYEYMGELIFENYLRPCVGFGPSKTVYEYIGELIFENNSTKCQDRGSDFRL